VFKKSSNKFQGAEKDEQKQSGTGSHESIVTQFKGAPCCWRA